MNTTQSPSLRWWPAALIVAGAAVSLVVTWWGEGADTQVRVLSTYRTVIVAFLLLVVWWLVLSRVRWRTRLVGIAALALVGGLCASLFRIVGVDGDLLPVIAFRWAGDGDFELVSGSAGVTTSPYDFPQFLGPGRDARIDSVRLDPDWQANPPVELWRREVGAAWSGFAVVGDAVVTLEQRDGQEVVARYDLETGEPVWTQAVDAVFDTTIGGSGPRSTPTIHDGRVYTLGATGVLRAVDLVSGELVWRRDLGADHGSQPPSWGFSGSPLLWTPPAGTPPASTPDDAVDTSDETTGEVLGPLVIVPAGGEGKTLVAYRAVDGEPVWAAGEDRIGYSSPSLHVLAGVEQVVSFNGGSVSGHAPEDGRLLWSHPWSSDQPNVAQPLALGEDRLLVSSGYGIGSAVLRVALSASSSYPLVRS